MSSSMSPRAALGYRVYKVIVVLAYVAVIGAASWSLMPAGARDHAEAAGLSVADQQMSRATTSSRRSRHVQYVRTDATPASQEAGTDWRGVPLRDVAPRYAHRSAPKDMDEEDEQEATFRMLDEIESVSARFQEVQDLVAQEVSWDGDTQEAVSRIIQTAQAELDELHEELERGKFGYHRLPEKIEQYQLKAIDELQALLDDSQGLEPMLSGMALAFSAETEDISGYEVWRSERG